MSKKKLKDVWYACPSCPVDQKGPGTCDVCGRPLQRRES